MISELIKFPKAFSMLSSTFSPNPAAAFKVPRKGSFEILLPRREPLVATVRRSRLSRPPRGCRPVVMHLHSGNFTTGEIESSTATIDALAEAGAEVVSLAYPLAPLHPFPDALEVCYEAFEWLYKRRATIGGLGAPVFVAGEEAGGNLAAALSMLARDCTHSPFAGQILWSPMLDPRGGTASFRQSGSAETRASYILGWDAYLSRCGDIDHPYAVPSSSRRLQQLPRALIVLGNDDPMRDEARDYGRRLVEAGGKVQFHQPAQAIRPDATAPTDAESNTTSLVLALREFLGSGRV